MGDVEQTPEQKLREVQGLLSQWAPDLRESFPVLFRKLDLILQLSQPEVPAMTNQPTDTFASDLCPYGEGQASGSGCIKRAGHDGDHVVTPGVPEQDDWWRAPAGRLGPLAEQ